MGAATGRIWGQGLAIYTRLFCVQVKLRPIRDDFNAASRGLSTRYFGVWNMMAV